MTDQLILKFPIENAYLKEDYYVSSSNQEAYDFINSWPKWIKRIANIFGPTGSGKTHLASMLKKKTSTLYTTADALNDKIFFEFKTKEALIIENLDEKVSENLLFSLWNTALQDNKYILITSNKPIDNYNFKLPDLKSRAKSSINIGIKLPSDDLISVIIAKNFSELYLGYKPNAIIKEQVKHHPPKYLRFFNGIKITAASIILWNIFVDFDTSLFGRSTSPRLSQLTLIDFGSVGNLNRSEQKSLIKLILIMLIVEII